MLVPGGLNPLLLQGVAPEVILLGQNFTSVSYDIGNPRSDRIVVVAGQREQDGTSAHPSITINGVDATAIYNTGTTDPMFLGYAQVATGASVSIAGGVSRSAAWLLRGVSALQQVLTASGTSPAIDIAVTLPAAPSAIIGIARSRSLMASGSVQVSGVLRDAALDASSVSGSGNSGWVTGHAYADGDGAGIMSLISANNFNSGLAAAGVFI